MLCLSLHKCVVRMRALAPLLGLLVLAVACASTPAWQRSPTETERQACAARGGRYEQVGMLGTWSCVIDYADGGARCSDSSECAGQCVTDADPLPHLGDEVTGTCQRNNALFGCYAEVKNGRAEQPMCFD